MISNLSAEQLRRAASVKEQIEKLEVELQGLIGSTNAAPSTSVKRGMSPAARARIGAAQRARWAKLKGKAEKPTGRSRRKMSAAARAKIAAAAKARWAKAKAVGKNRL
jgi:hypothetical protein